jgi:hypothetical protein
MPLKSRNDFPPNGFTFYQAETGWTSPPYIGFSPTVDEIIKHRQSNPRFKLSTNRGEVEVELENYTIARLKSQYGDKADQWITGNAPPTVFTPPLPRRRVVGAVGAVAIVHKAVAGVGLVLDFLGPKLKPVDRPLAEKRGSICAVCPLNQPGTALEQAGGKALHLLLEYKADQKMETIWDDRLLWCHACGCSLKLKVHVGLDYILSRLKPEEAAALDPKCWIRNHDST